MNANLDGKTALVTGASRGIGRAIALVLAENGADVFATSFGSTPELAQEVVVQIEAMGRRSGYAKADLTDYGDTRRMVDTAIRHLGKIDILVACGGRSSLQPQFFRDTDPETYMAYAATRWFNKANPIKAVLEHMIEGKGGKIVIITSDAGRVPSASMAMHGGATAAVVMMTRVLGKEFSRWGIRINCICTTMTQDTPGWEESISRGDSKVHKKAVERMPFGPNKSGDLAQAALYFAAEESDQITGQILTISGGLSFPG